MNKMDIEELRRLIDYNPKTGKLTWKVRRSNLVKAGMPALTARKSSGHCSGFINRKSMQAHRVAWAIHYGEWPTSFIDHINGVRDDNRIENLRVVSSRDNAKNRRANSQKKSGLPHGVSVKSNGRFFAQIQHKGKNNHLGYFETVEQAEAAYLAAKSDLGFHANHGLRALKEDRQ